MFVTGHEYLELNMVNLLIIQSCLLKLQVSAVNFNLPCLRACAALITVNPKIVFLLVIFFFCHLCECEFICICVDSWKSFFPLLIAHHLSASADIYAFKLATVYYSLRHMTGFVFYLRRSCRCAVAVRSVGWCFSRSASTCWAKSLCNSV